MGQPSKGWLRAVLILLGAAAASVAAARYVHGPHSGRRMPGGMVIGDTGAYEAFSRRMLGSFFRHIADDVAATAPTDARVLEVGCGPGHLSIQLARRHGLDVTGVDLDPAMIEQARANATHMDDIDGRPSFQVGDVARLDFPDESFDLVVSSLSMHHWADPTAGLSEIGRVLHLGGRALLWDLRPDIWPLHRHIPDPVDHARGTRLRVAAATAWRWPWKLSLTQRTELVRAEEPARHSAAETMPHNRGEAHG